LNKVKITGSISPELAKKLAPIPALINEDIERVLFACKTMIASGVGNKDELFNDIDNLVSLLRKLRGGIDGNNRNNRKVDCSSTTYPRRPSVVNPIQVRCSPERIERKRDLVGSD